MDYDGGSWFILGDSGAFHFHGAGANDIFSSQYAHNNIKNGASFRVNGSIYDIYGSWPTNFSIYSLVTSGNVQAIIFHDRNIGGRYAKASLGELLIFNQALSEESVSQVEQYLTYKWGLTDQIAEASSKKLSFDSDSDFLNLELGTNSYHNSLALFKGHFRALESGTYIWELLNVDDQAAIGSTWTRMELLKSRRELHIRTLILKIVSPIIWST